MTLEDLKQRAAEKAVEYVKDGMVLGLGTGSTTMYAIRKIGELVRREGYELIGIPTSVKTEKLALELGITLSTLDEHPIIDLTIDGADEVDPNLHLIKGMGGALLREKIVAEATRVEVIIVDYTKLVSKLGTKSPLPVEVLPFGLKPCMARLQQQFKCNVEVRKTTKGEKYVTDNGNYIVDCKFISITNPHELEIKLNVLPGVVGTGLFLGLAHKVIVASPPDKIEVKTRGGNKV